MDLTKDEMQAINSLKRLSKNWPESLWLFSANSSLEIMRKNDGEVMRSDSGGYDQNYIVDTINIENDGGDW